MPVLDVFHAAADSAVNIAGVIPDPDPVQPPGTEGVTTILAWLKWIGYVVVGGAIIAQALRLAVIVIGGAILVEQSAPLSAVFALSAGAMILMGLATALFVRLSRWG